MNISDEIDGIIQAIRDLPVPQVITVSNPGENPAVDEWVESLNKQVNDDVGKFLRDLMVYGTARLPE